MEKFICKKDGKVGHFKTEIKVGMEFPVLRTIMNECVLVTSENKPNIITAEKQLRRYGELSGTPTLGG